MRVVKVEKEKLEAVSEFCYLGDMLSAGGCCVLAAVSPSKCDGRQVLLPVPSLLTNRSLSLVDRNRVYSTCEKNVMLHAVETWAMTAATQNSLWRNELAQIHWFCNVKVRDEIIYDSLLSKPGIQDLDVKPRTSRIRWLERSTGWIAEVSKLNVVAQKRRSRPTKICNEVQVDNRIKLGVDCAVQCLRTMVPSFSIQG